MDPIGKHFLNRSAWQLRDHLLPRIREAVLRLTEVQLWERASEASNSVGNLLLHLAGNVRQHAVAGLGGARDVRDRPSEFAARGGATRAELLERLDIAVGEACAVLESFDPSRLLETGKIQGKEVLFLDDVYHVVEHFSYHTGQILHMVKAATREGFPWYKHLDQGAGKKL